MEQGFTTKDLGGTFWGTDDVLLFYILIGASVTWVHAFVKARGAVQLRLIHFIEYKLYLS